MITGEPNTKTRLLFAIGLGLWRTQSPSMASDQTKSTTLMRLAFFMDMIASGMVVTGAGRQGRPNSVHPGNREWITVIQAINAEGQAIPPFIIGPGQYHLATWYRESNLPGNWAIATSENAG
jgi:hypothetical protein